MEAPDREGCCFDQLITCFTMLRVLRVGGKFPDCGKHPFDAAPQFRQQPQREQNEYCEQRKKTSGYFNASHKPAKARVSSLKEAVQLLNGSGEVLISARPPDLAR